MKKKAGDFENLEEFEESDEEEWNEEDLDD